MALFNDISDLNPQQESKQSTHKLSYYVTTQADRTSLFTAMQNRLTEHDYKANLIWSVDETKDRGLLDVVPKSATKLHAIKFLMQHANFQLNNTVFSGDSGNDLAVLTSDIPARLVNNAQPEVRYEAIEKAGLQATKINSMYRVEIFWV